MLGGGWSKETVLTFEVPVPLANGVFTLLDATPVPISNEEAASSGSRHIQAPGWPLVFERQPNRYKLLGEDPSRPTLH